MNYLLSTIHNRTDENQTVRVVALNVVHIIEIDEAVKMCRLHFAMERKFDNYSDPTIF